MDDLLVIGGGILGIAVAREYLQRRPGAAVTVLEADQDLAGGQTGHNSGVIHAGLYYAPGSLKARLCKIGARATMAFCQTHGVPYRKIGKLVVATNAAEVERMGALAERAAANGIDLTPIDASSLAELEPHIRGRAALFSANTAVVDFARVARAMAAQVRQAGGRVSTGAAVRAISERRDEVIVATDTSEHGARQVVACAGLQADRVARLGGLPVDFRIVPFRGEYYQLPPSRADVVSHLIYPVPDPALPFLGVHLSPTVDGRVTVGPNAVLGFSRTKYPRGSITPSDVASYLTYPGMWRFASRNMRTGIREMTNSLFRRGYLRQVRTYCPSLELHDLLPHPAGIRAQAIRRDGSAVEDFLLRSTDRQLHVCNAPSPAATSAIPIAGLINDRLGLQQM